MKVYPGVEDTKNARVLAKKLGLNKIKTKDTYKLYKTGAKVEAPFPYTDIFCERGNVYVAAKDSFIWIIIANGAGRWYKTSPVVSCTKILGGYKLETVNSFYEIRDASYKTTVEEADRIKDERDEEFLGMFDRNK